MRIPLLGRLAPATAPEPPHIADDRPAVDRLRSLAGQLRRGLPYTALARTHSPEGFGALVREALHDVEQQHARQLAVRDAALDEMAAELEEARAHLAENRAEHKPLIAELLQRGELIDRLRSTPTPEALWMEVKVSEEGQRARHFARLYGRASATIGQQRDTIARLRAERASWWGAREVRLVAADAGPPAELDAAELPRDVVGEMRPGPTAEAST